MRTRFSTDIDQWTTGDQLEFYKDQFQTRHCVLSGHEVRDDWVMYEGELYTKEYYDLQIEREKKKAYEEIKKMELEISELKEKYDFSSLEEDEKFDFSNYK